ncbi:alpha/beta hydrolase [Streptomyces sp. NPDC002018]|uniref:alpha/beta hydrolase n=1 Tax=Streptomyces sp. NPDC002018 TaxID=3364629 RepID=UPI0036BCD67E
MFSSCTSPASPTSTASSSTSTATAPSPVSFTGGVVTGLDPELLDAQREANLVLAQMPQPDVTTPEGLAVLRALTSPVQPSSALTPEDITVPGPGGDLRLRVFVPDGPVRGVFLRLHGGGWAAGTPEDDESFNDRIARHCRVAVVSPEYRLVPEAGIADQIEDCLAAARWAAAQARDRFGTDSLLIGGISAGGHLAATVTLRLRDADEPAFALLDGALLDCGAYDLSFTPSVRAADDTTLVLPRTWLDGLTALGLPGLDTAARKDPALSPLYADLTGLPPALFTVGALDPLRDDSVFLSALWRLAGNRADLDIWPEAAHAFTNMGTPLAEAAFRRTTSWIDALYDGDAPRP